jgi:hypothetical protein
VAKVWEGEKEAAEPEQSREGGCGGAEPAEGLLLCQASSAKSKEPRAGGRAGNSPALPPSPGRCPATSKESLASVAWWCPEDGQGPADLVFSAVLLGVCGPQG